MKITSVVTGTLVTLIFNCVQSMLVTKPSDAAAKVGDFVIMTCSSTYVNDTRGKITWKHFKLNSESGDYINIGNQLSDSAASYISLINTSAGSCNLRINAVTSAAGRYECHDPTPDDANAQLIVLENDPEVEIVKTSRSNNITLRCSVHYYGNWVPKVKWMKNGLESVASNDSETSKSLVSSLVQIPLATFDPTGETEHLVCIVTISQSGGSNKPIYTWRSLKNDTTWVKNGELESAAERQVSCNASSKVISIGLVLFVISTGGCVASVLS